MKKLILFFLLVFVLPTIALSDTATQEHMGDLHLIITGFRNNNGQARIGLVNSEKDFKGRREETKNVRGVSVKIENKRVDYIFHDLPFGEYAIKFYHDENNNDKLDVNMLGIPREPYGFSNNARGKLGMPPYEKARFLFGQKELTITIELN